MQSEVSINEKYIKKNLKSSLKNRYDGIFLKNLDYFQRFFPHIMKTRTESLIYLKQQIEIENVLKYIKSKNKEPGHPKMTLFHIFIAAVLRTLALRPHLNRFIVGRRIYARKNYEISFIIKQKLTEDGREITAKIPFEPTDTLKDVSTKIAEFIDEFKNDPKKSDDVTIKFIMKTPRFIVNFIVWVLGKLDYYNLLPKFIASMDPLRASVFVANLGSIGLDAPFHHLYEWGTTSIFMVLGKKYKTAVVSNSNSIDIKDVVDVAFTLDERISDGFYYARSIELFKYLIEHPEELEKIPKEIESELE